MTNNLESIREVVAFIEDHLEANELDLNLANLAKQVGYSKYHLHRMFTAITGFTLHTYILRRRLTEAARSLVFTEKSIINIALTAGYKTQQSFSLAFKTYFDCSPQVFREKKNFYPLQLAFSVDGQKKLRGDQVMNIQTFTSERILLVGYTANTQDGFAVIGECMGKIQRDRKKIKQRTEADYVVALNDYSRSLGWNSEQPAFDFYATYEVLHDSEIPEGMVQKELPPSKYIIFSFFGRPQDSLQPVADYIYQEWFPQSTCQFNEKNMYDFTKSFTETDEFGNSKVEYWVPIL